MAAIDFPQNPAVGQQFAVGTETWTWDGVKWTAYPGALSIPDAPSDTQLWARKSATVGGAMSWSLASSGGGLVDAPTGGLFYGRRSGGWTQPLHTDITDWTTALAPYALAANVPIASSTLPQMDGLAAVGATGTWADGAHIHPTDNSRYAASNPAGYQTATQISASLAGYLPLAGGTMTGPLAGTTAAFSGALTAGPVSSSGAVVATNTVQVTATAGNNPLFQAINSNGQVTARMFTLGVAGVAYFDNPLHGININLSTTVNVTGNMIANGDITSASLHTSSLVSPNWLYSGDSSFALYAAPSERYLQYAGTWYWGWATATGRLRWVGNPGGTPTELFTIDGVGNTHANGQLSSGSVSTGGITCTTINTQGNGISCGGLTVSGQTGTTGNCLNGATYPAYYAGATAWALYGNSSTCVEQFQSYRQWATASGGEMAHLDVAGNFQVSGTGYKAGGGPWNSTSDARIKTVLGEYTSGLDDVLKLRPVRYAYRGNDTMTEDFIGPEVSAEARAEMGEVTSAPYPNSAHFIPAKAQTEFVGLVAQEVEPIFPGMVTSGEGFVDGQKIPDLKFLDTNELIYALVNAVKTLSARVAELEGAR